MSANAECARLGVIGWPVAHSRSPAMQNAALRAVGLERWRYQLLPVPPHLLAQTVAALPQAGFRGVNVTIPHKEVALQLAGERTGRAQAIGAANTLLFAGDEELSPNNRAPSADNTDAPALIEALPIAPAGRSALVLGAGGSARAAVWALLDAGAREVMVWNRTAGRAERLCVELGARAVTEAAPADLLVNCTSAGMQRGQAPFKQLPLCADDLDRYQCVVDYVYKEGETALVQAARARGALVVDGLELLVKQGALSFEQFTGHPAPVEAMEAAARGA